MVQVFSSTKFLKRGIPGVDSDAYHFGYFEDTTGLKAEPPNHSRLEPLFEVLFIFGCMVLIYAVFTFACYSLREYLLSFRKRDELYADGSSWSNHSLITLTQENNSNDRVVNDLQNPAYPRLSHQTPQHQRVRRRNNENDSNLQIIPDVMYNSLNIVEASPGQNYSDTSFDEFTPLRCTKLKHVYSIRELLALRPAEYDGIPLTNIEQNGGNDSVLCELKFSSEFKHIDFLDGRNAVKTLTEIMKSVTNQSLDRATRQLQIYRFIVIGGNAAEYNNPNVYLRQMNQFMDRLIDTALIYEIINESNPYLARSLFQMTLQYCYSHWYFNSYAPKNVDDKFFEWNMKSQPLVQPNTVIFRYLINLQLGSTILEIDSDTASLIHSKLRYLLKILIKDTSCNDTEPIITLISEANEVSTNSEARRVFFEALSDLIRVHSECCQSVLFQQENFALKYLMKFGLWDRNKDVEIRKYSTRIYKKALSKNENIECIWKDKPPRAHTPNLPQVASVPTSSKELPRPGSWKTTADR